MKIKTQFNLATFVFCIIFILIGLSLLYTHIEVNRLGEQQEVARDVVRGAYELSYLSNDYLFHPEEQRQNIQWDSRYAVLSGDISRLSVDTPEQQMLVDRITANKNRLHDVYMQSVVAIEASKTTHGQSVDPELIVVAWSRFVVQNQAMIFDASQLSQLLQEQSDYIQNVNTALIFLLMVFLLLFLLTNYVFIKRRILQSISALNDGTKIIGKGNLDFRLDTHRDDEIGDLSVAFNRMTSNLSEVTASKSDLEHEIIERKKAEDALRDARDNLEIQVQERTVQLTGANKDLRHEIFERKRAEEALHESARYNRNLIEVSLDPLVTISPEGKITDVNTATELVTGYTRDLLIGTDFSDYFTDTDKAKKGYMKVFDSGVVRDYPLEIRNSDGKITSVLYNATIYSGESGTKQGVFAAARDITERKRAEEALRQVNKKLKLLSSITRHDINNQLTVLMGFLSILKKKQPDPTLDEYFVKLATAAQRISSMIKFTKEYDNIGVNAPAWQDCRTVVDTATKEASIGQGMVKNDLPAGAEMFADPLVVKVFYNLMDNAVRYGGKITTIRFSVEEASDDHVIICEDDGDGVVAEEKEKIFERGFGKNTGMGLFLSREILAITGITIRETGEPDKGARFEILVPKGAWRMTGNGT